MPEGSLTYLFGVDPIHLLSDSEKVDYLEKRIERLLLVPARNAREAATGGKDLRPTIDSNLCLMTVLCCGIEALGHYLAGRVPKPERCPTCEHHLDPEKGAADFAAFVERYMPSYAPIAKLLYGDYRSALAHGFAIRSGGLTEGLSVPFETPKDKTLPHRIDFWRFVSELDEGVKQYFRDVRIDPDLTRKFLQRWAHANKFWIENSRIRDSAGWTE